MTTKNFNKDKQPQKPQVKLPRPDPDTRKESPDEDIDGYSEEIIEGEIQGKSSQVFSPLN